MVCSPVFAKKDQSHLQFVLNAAARVLANTNKEEHITLVLKSLHWLSVCQRDGF